jgi:hypothetical protein
MVRESIPGGGVRFYATVQTGPGAHPASYTMSTGSFPGVKRPKRGANRLICLAPKLKKELSYTSTPSLGLYGLLRGKLFNLQEIDTWCT